MPLINCEIGLILTWSKNCVLISKATREADNGADPVVYKIDNPENAALSTENDKKIRTILEQLKS